jgi:hypothetical protein
MADLTQVPIAPELQELLAKDWSRPVEVKIEDGELLFRNVPDARRQWEDELLSDEAVGAARRANAEAWDQDFPVSGKAIIAQTLRAALAATKKGGE